MLASTNVLIVPDSLEFPISTIDDYRRPVSRVTAGGRSTCPCTGEGCRVFCTRDDRLQQIQDGSLRAERHLRRWPAEVAKFADRFQMRHERVERNKSIRLHRHAHPARPMAQDVAELLGQSRSLTRPHVHHCPRREGRAAAGGTAPPAAPLARHRRHSAPRSRPLVSRRARATSRSLPAQRSRRSRRDYKITLVRVRVTCTAHTF